MARPLTNQRWYWTTTPYLRIQVPSVARRKGPGSVYLLRKYTLNGQVNEATTASGPHTKVGVKAQAASRPPYDHPTASKPHVEQPTEAYLLGCKLGA